MSPNLLQLSPHLYIFRDNINVGMLIDGHRAQLIDTGAGNVADVLPSLGISEVDEVLFTHYHRDQLCGVEWLLPPRTRIGVPADERQWFETPQRYWDDPVYRWRLYLDMRPNHLMPVVPVRVDRDIVAGETITWGPAHITALATPGHTDGNLTYLIDVDGQRVAFSGDLLYAPGQFWELYSLQLKEFKANTDYHGFLGARSDFATSLATVAEAHPDILIPSHGEVMRDPAAAIALTAERLKQCYAEYVATASLRWYFPETFADVTPLPDALPMQRVSPPPDFLRHVGTSWVLVSETGAAFVMDCLGDETVETLQQWIEDGIITTVEGLWITHYHFDHTDGIPAVRRLFDCPIYADRSLAQVLTNPSAWWRLPCLAPEQVTIERVTEDGERWQWREFILTAYHFPGQTLYHGGLLVEGRGMRLFFTGDSFSPTGIDDYCMQNRNFLGDGKGFDRCVALLQRLKPDYLFNEHVEVAFAYSDDAYALLRRHLKQREQSYTALLPWEHANFGMDDAWVTCWPYEQRCAPGTDTTIEVVVTNHASEPRECTAHLVLPDTWAPCQPVVGTIAAKEEGRLHCPLTIPADVLPGQYIIPVDITFHDRYLPQFTEAIIIIPG